MKKLSLILASALLLGGISFASPVIKHSPKQTDKKVVKTDAKTVKTDGKTVKSEKKVVKKDGKKTVIKEKKTVK